MYAPERQQAMASLVVRSGRASVAELAERFQVTGETVRRDLDALARSGILRRVHGGAVPVEALTLPETDVAQRETARSDDKERIAAAARAELPPAGATALFDAGTTTARLAAALPADTRLVAFTHALPVAQRLATLSRLELHVLGGRLRGTTQAAVGAGTVAALSALHVDVAFVGTNGLTVDHGLSTPDSDEAAVKAALVGAARRVVVLADSSKLGRVQTFRFAQLEQIDALITDRDADARLVAQLRAQGVEVTLA